MGASVGTVGAAVGDVLGAAVGVVVGLPVGLNSGAVVGVQARRTANYKDTWQWVPATVPPRARSSV